MKFFRNLWYRAVAEKRPGLGWALCRFLLWLLSLVYRVILGIRNILISGTRLDVLVISVGNLTLGGTGKTPMVAYLAKMITQKGKRGAILSRGYGKVKASADDEAFVMSEFPGQSNITRHTGQNRVRMARVICQESSPDVIILDDGFQHRRMKRDIDIVMINSLSPFGNGRLFPFGHLREPRRALSRADLIVLTHTNLIKTDELTHLLKDLKHFNHPIIKSTHQPVGLISINAGEALEPEDLRSRKVWAFCGIGYPFSFRKTLQHCGINPVGFTEFPDHYVYEEADIADLNARAESAGAEVMLTTQKDQAQLARFDRSSWQMPVYAFKVELELTEGKEFLDRILNL